MKYKGYIANIEYDESVDMFHGAVINAAPYPIATFMASDVEGLKREFRISIDDYLEWCREDGCEPLPPRTRKLSLVMDAELHRRVAHAAARYEMSIDGWVRDVIEREAKKCEADSNKGCPGSISSGYMNDA